MFQFPLSKQSCYDLLVHALLCQFDSEDSILAQHIKIFFIRTNWSFPWTHYTNYIIWNCVLTWESSLFIMHHQHTRKAISSSLISVLMWAREVTLTGVFQVWSPERRRKTGDGERRVSSRQLSSVSSGHWSWSQERKPLQREKTADADTGVVTNTSSTCFELQYLSRKVNSLMKWFS